MPNVSDMIAVTASPGFLHNSRQEYRRSCSTPFILVKSEMVTRENRTATARKRYHDSSRKRDRRGTELWQKLGVGGGESVIVDAEGLGTSQRGCEREHANGARALKSVTAGQD